MPEEKENKFYITDAHLTETGPREEDDPRAFNGAKLVTESFEKVTNEDGTEGYNWTIKFVPDAKIEPAKEKDNFIMVRQDNTINALARTSNKAGIKQLDFTNKGIIKATNGSTDIQVIIEEYANITLKPSTSKLLMLITWKFTQTNNKLIKLSLKEYMQLTAKKDEKEARREIKEDLNTLYNISCKAESKDKKSRIEFRVFDMKGDIKNSVIIANLSDSIATHLLNCPVMPYSKGLFEIPNKYPYAYYLGHKINELMKYNQHKPFFVTSVKTLLNSCCFNNGMPTYEEVQTTDRAIDRRIITPFENNITASSEYLNFIWEYSNEKGTPLTDKQLQDRTYKEFEARYIKITFKEYPEVEINVKKHKETKKSKSKKESKKTA